MQLGKSPRLIAEYSALDQFAVAVAQLNDDPLGLAFPEIDESPGRNQSFRPSSHRVSTTDFSEAYIFTLFFFSVRLPKQRLLADIILQTAIPPVRSC